MTIQETHDRAIELADEAFVLRFRNRNEEAKVFFVKAFQLEKEAAMQAVKLDIAEPSRSILLKSAASLAMNCDETREAEKLISLALAGEPPTFIIEELRDMLEEVNFDRHLELRGVSLDNSEVQLAITGSDISYGLARSGEVLNRINVFEKLAVRTVERKSGKAFREKGSVSAEIKREIQPYISVPRAASFAISIRFGKMTNQTKLDNMYGITSSAIDEVFENIELVSNDREDELRSKINDEAYYRNFVSLTKELAPDGDKVKLVGMTIIRNGEQKKLKLTKIKSSFNIIENNESETNFEMKSISGKLSFADSTVNKIKIISKTKRYEVTVPAGLGDIVKSHWDEEVKITCRVMNGFYHLVSIDTLSNI